MAHMSKYRKGLDEHEAEAMTLWANGYELFREAYSPKATNDNKELTRMQEGLTEWGIRNKPRYYMLQLGRQPVNRTFGQYIKDWIKGERIEFRPKKTGKDKKWSWQEIIRRHAWCEKNEYRYMKIT